MGLLSNRKPLSFSRRLFTALEYRSSCSQHWSNFWSLYQTEETPTLVQKQQREENISHSMFSHCTGCCLVAVIVNSQMPRQGTRPPCSFREEKKEGLLRLTKLCLGLEAFRGLRPSRKHIILLYNKQLPCQILRETSPRQPARKAYCELCPCCPEVCI